MQKSFLLTVHKVVQETPEAISIHFLQPQVDRIWYRSGQYLTLRLSIADQVYYRSYSISTVAGHDDTLAITIKRVAGGVVSNYLLDHIRPGDQLEASRPLGRFFIENSVKAQRQIVLMGAGSGMTPLFSILRATLYQEPHSRISLLYANRNASKIIFRAELERLQELFGNRLTIQHILSQPEPETKIPYAEGRTTAEHLEQFSQLIGPPEWPREYFICGPEGWMELVLAFLNQKGIPAEKIHQEHFRIDDQEQKKHLPDDGPMRKVEVTMGDQTYGFNVPAGATILDAATFAGVDLPFSCKAGTCATCMGRLLDGEVSMENNDALLDFEIEQGKVLVCQAHPTSDDVKIRIGW